MSKLELVALIVRDYDAAIRFFVDVLHFQLVEDTPSLTNDGRPKRWVVVRPAGGQTGILLARADGDQQTSMVGQQFAGRVGLFLRVDDFNAEYQRMVTAGVRFLSPPRDETYGRVVVFLDLEGNRWDLSRRRRRARERWRSARLNDARLGSDAAFDGRCSTILATLRQDSPGVRLQSGLRNNRMPINKQWTLASRPAGWVSEDNFALIEAPAPTPDQGEALVRNRWLSVDPYMRGRMSDAKSYVKGLDIGDVMVGQTVGDVVESRHPGLKPGDTVLTPLGWQLYGCAKGDTLTKVDGSRAPLSYYLGMLGMTGMTAYFGLKEIGRPKAGETVAVSAAAGAVGGIVGQLAKIAGCRAVGIAGGPEKCEYVVKELGFDACVDYKAGHVDRELSRVCPKGVDVYFDNVAGPVLDSVLPLMNLASRLVVCGAIADYNSTEPYAVTMWRSILVNRIRVQGMIVFDWSERYGEAALALAGYYAEGRLKARESVVEGLERAPQALIAMLKGQNVGKQLVKLA